MAPSGLSLGPAGLGFSEAFGDFNLKAASHLPAEKQKARNRGRAPQVRESRCFEFYMGLSLLRRTAPHLFGGVRGKSKGHHHLEGAKQHPVALAIRFRGNDSGLGTAESTAWKGRRCHRSSPSQTSQRRLLGVGRNLGSSSTNAALHVTQRQFSGKLIRKGVYST